MDNAFEAIVPIVAIVMTFGIPGIILFWFLYSKHRERMRLIEKGLTPEEVKAYYTDTTNKPKNPYASLKWGVLLTFVGAGIFLANLFEGMYDLEEGVMMGIIVLCAGLGFLVYYGIVSSKIKNNTSDTQI